MNNVVNETFSRKVPVMLLFFNRPENLLQVFNAVREYQPAQLFLVQDGARKSRPDDHINIQKCREIVSNVDWPCDVKTNYAEENLTCDHREYTGISWCFKFVDRLIILEDDCLPVKSFFYFCEENLELYKDNQAVHSIYGFNRVGKYRTPYDYIFSISSAGWGWATWKRVWNLVEDVHSLSLFNNKEFVNYIRKAIDKNIFLMYGDFIRQGINVKKNNEESNRISSWEYVVGLVLILNNMVTIVPSVNMVKYLGISKNATHTCSNPRLLPYKVARVLLQPAFEIDYNNIKHPPYLLRDSLFEKLSRKSLRYPFGFAKLEVLIRRILYKCKIL